MSDKNWTILLLVERLHLTKHTRSGTRRHNAGGGFNKGLLLLLLCVSGCLGLIEMFHHCAEVRTLEVVESQSHRRQRFYFCCKFASSLNSSGHESKSSLRSQMVVIAFEPVRRFHFWWWFWATDFWTGRYQVPIRYQRIWVSFIKKLSIKEKRGWIETREAHIYYKVSWKYLYLPT